MDNNPFDVFGDSDDDDDQDEYHNNEVVMEITTPPSTTGTNTSIKYQQQQQQQQEDQRVIAQSLMEEVNRRSNSSSNSSSTHDYHHQNDSNKPITTTTTTSISEEIEYLKELYRIMPPWKELPRIVEEGSSSSLSSASGILLQHQPFVTSQSTEILTLEQIQQVQLPTVDVSLSYRPMYFNSNMVQFVPSLDFYGGSRGFVARQSILPGTLLLVEKPQYSFLKVNHPFGTAQKTEKTKIKTQSSASTTTKPHSNKNNNNTHQNQNRNQIHEPIELLSKLIHTSLLNENENKSHTVEAFCCTRKKMVNQIFHNMEYFHPTKTIVDEYFSRTNTVATTATTTTILDKNEKGEMKQQQGKQSSVLLPTNIPAKNQNDQIQIIDMIQSFYQQYCVQEEVVDSNENMIMTNDDEDYHTLDDVLTVQQIVQYCSTGQPQILNSNGTMITNIDIVRLLLALQYNALESGIYLYAAMLNHSDQPNCVKFQPTTTTSTSSSLSSSNPLFYSEVRTTRYVRKGEILTISYVPEILSYTSRYHYLWQHHRFGTTLVPIRLNVVLPTTVTTTSDAITKTLPAPGIQQQHHHQKEDEKNHDDIAVDTFDNNFLAANTYATLLTHMELIHHQVPPIPVIERRNVNLQGVVGAIMKDDADNEDDHDDNTSNLVILTQQIEANIHELQVLYHQVVQILHLATKSSIMKKKSSSKNTSMGTNDDNNDDFKKEKQQQQQQAFEQLISIERSVWDFLDEISFLVQNDDHILLIPTLQLHIDCIDTIQRYAGTQTTSKILPFKSGSEIRHRLITSCRTLLPLQKMFHGPDHFDLARTYLDLANSIESYLSFSAHLVQKTNNNSHTATTDNDKQNYQPTKRTVFHNDISFRTLTTLENTSRKEYQRIQALYPRDVGDYIIHFDRLSTQTSMKH